MVSPLVPPPAEVTAPLQACGQAPRRQQSSRGRHATRRGAGFCCCARHQQQPKPAQRHEAWRPGRGLGLTAAAAVAAPWGGDTIGGVAQAQLKSLGGYWRVDHRHGLAHAPSRPGPQPRAWLRPTSAPMSVQRESLRPLAGDQRRAPRWRPTSR